MNEKIEKRQMVWSDIMPNCRVNMWGFVEIPQDFSKILPPCDPELIPERMVRLMRLIRAHKMTRIYDEQGNNHRGMVWGSMVPIETWDRYMGEKIEGWMWVSKHD